MKHSILSILIGTILVFSTSLIVHAQPATIAWDPSPEPEVVGYRIYYKTDNASFPFNGTTLPEGTSPITVSGATSTALTVDLPEDGRIYYFTATAVSGTGVESNYSEIIASEWIPFLLAPTDSAATGTSVTFSWDLPPAGYNVTYELHYGSDPALTLAAVPPTGADRPNHPNLDWRLALPLALLLALVTTRRKKTGRLGWRPVRVGLVIGLLALQTACGGGGSDGGVIGGIPSVPAEPVPTTVVSGISTTSFQVSDLQPGTDYFWKIVAVDETGYAYESTIKSFSTQAN